MKKNYLIILIITFLLPNFIMAQDDSTDVEDMLDLSLEQLMELEVTVAGKIEEKVSEIPASVVIMTRKDIENYGFVSLSELLQHISGLYYIDGYSYETGVFGTRGFWADGNNDNYAVLVNNIYQNNIKLTVPVQIIDRVEIIRGPMSVIYGSGSMYGAINIVTNEASKNTVATSYGNNNKLNTIARVAGQEGDIKYVFNFGFDKTDGLDVEYNDLMGTDNFSDFQLIESFLGETIPDDYSSKKHFEKEQRYFYFYGNFKDFYISATHINNYYERFFIYPTINNGVSSHNNKTGFTLGWQKEVTNYLSVNAKSSYYHNSENENYDLLTKINYGITNSKYNIVETELDLNFKISDKFNFVLGGKYYTLFDYLSVIDIPTAGDPNNINNLRYSKKGDDLGTGAGFTQFTYSPINNLKIVAGIRLEKSKAFTRNYQLYGGSTDPNFLPEIGTMHYNETDLIIIPRVAAVYTFNDNHIFKLLYGEATQMQGEEFKAKKQTTYEFDYLFTKENYTLSLSVFRNSFENLLNYEFLYSSQTQVYSEAITNSGNMYTNGAELNFITQPFTDFKIEVGGTYQQTIDADNKDITVAYSPNFLGQIKMFYVLGKFSFAITGYYVDEMESLWIKENPITNEPAHRLGKKAEGYFNLGTNIRADNIYKGLYANLRVSNILDTEIRYPTIQSTSPLANGTLGQIRMIFATIGWKF